MRFGGAIAPGEPGQFSPERGRCAVRLCQVSTKSEVAGVKQATEAIGESKCFGSLRQRNVGGAASDLPVVMRRVPFMRNVARIFPPNASTSNCNPTSLVSQTREIDRSGLQVEAARQSESGECQSVASQRVAPRNCEKVWRNHGDVIISSAALKRPASVSLEESDALRSKIKVGPVSTRISSLAMLKFSGSNLCSVAQPRFGYRLHVWILAAQLPV